MHTYLAAGADNAALTVLGILVFLAGAGLYCVPSVIAAARNVPGKGQVVVVNLLLGWTVIGWVVALVMAFRAVPPRPQQYGIWPANR